MAQDEGFKHITVAPAEDDDVIIHAGIVKDDSADEELKARVEEDAGDVQVDRGGSEPEPVEAPAPKPRPAQAAASSRKRDEYRETTLEDLESIRMSTTQKVVIIAAVVCIIGAIVYWIAFMG